MVHGAECPVHRSQGVGLPVFLKAPAPMRINRVSKSARRARMDDRPLIGRADDFIEREVREVMIPQ